MAKRGYQLARPEVWKYAIFWLQFIHIYVELIMVVTTIECNPDAAKSSHRALQRPARLPPPRGAFYDTSDPNGLLCHLPFKIRHRETLSEDRQGGAWNVAGTCFSYIPICSNGDIAIVRLSRSLGTIGLADCSD